MLENKIKFEFPQSPKFNFRLISVLSEMGYGYLSKFQLSSNTWWWICFESICHVPLKIQFAFATDNNWEIMCSRYFNYKLGNIERKECLQKTRGEKPFNTFFHSHMTGNVMQQEKFIELGPLKVTSSLEGLLPWPWLDQLWMRTR